MSIPQEIFAEIKKLAYKSTDRGLIFTIGNGEMNVARTLTRHLKLKDKGYKDNQIRDLAEEIESELHDGLVFCKTIEDHVEWATPNGGCMKLYPGGVSYYRPDLSKEVYEKHKIWGSVFWMYNPDYQCVYLKAHGKAIARTWLYTDAEGKTGYCYVAGDYTLTGCPLGKALEKRGIPKCNLSYKQHSEFKIPAWESSAGPVCPMFKMDLYTGPLFCTFKDGEFHFSPKAGKLNIMAASKGRPHRASGGAFYDFCQFFTAAECS